MLITTPPPRLIHNLGSPDVHRSIKPQILSTFGDMALGLGASFEKYVDTVKTMLQQAMGLSAAQVRRFLVVGGLCPGCLLAAAKP